MLSNPQLATLSELISGHRLFWEFFSVCPAAFLGTLQGVSWILKAATLSSLYLEEGGVGTVPTPGLSKLCIVGEGELFVLGGEKIFLFFGMK